MDTNALRSRKRQRKAQRRRRAGRPARLCNAAIGVFGSNPKGTGVLGRHSVLPSSPRPLVLASSCALIGAPGHPFAYAPIALTGPIPAKTPTHEATRFEACWHVAQAPSSCTLRSPGIG